MKLRFFLTAIVAFLAFEAQAQHGLNVNALFQGKVVPHEEMVDVRVKGRAISKYKLDFYRSIRFNATEQQRKVVDDLVDSDCKTAMGTKRHDNPYHDVTQTGQYEPLPVLHHLPKRADDRDYCGLYGRQSGKYCRTQKTNTLKI